MRPEHLETKLKRIHRRTLMREACRLYVGMWRLLGAAAPELIVCRAVHRHVAAPARLRGLNSWRLAGGGQEDRVPDRRQDSFDHRAERGASDRRRLP